MRVGDPRRDRRRRAAAQRLPGTVANIAAVVDPDTRVGGGARRGREPGRPPQEADVRAGAHPLAASRPAACWCRSRRSCATTRTCPSSTSLPARRRLRAPARDARRTATVTSYEITEGLSAGDTGRGRRRHLPAVHAETNERRAAPPDGRRRARLRSSTGSSTSSLRQPLLVVLLTAGAGRRRYRARCSACRWMPIRISRRRWWRSSPSGRGMPPRRWSG